MLSQLKLLGIYQRELSKTHGCAGAALEAVAEAAVKDAVGGDEPVATLEVTKGWEQFRRLPTSCLNQMPIGTHQLYLRPQASAAVPDCEWSADGDDLDMPDTWDGACGARWTFTDGGPAENTMSFCPQCGGRVHVGDSQPRGLRHDLVATPEQEHVAVVQALVKKYWIPTNGNPLLC